MSAWMLAELRARLVAAREERDAAPPEPKPYPVLRYVAGWCIYSDGSDDDAIIPMPPGHWSDVLAHLTVKAGERCSLGRVEADPRGPYTALVDWPPRAAEVSRG